MECAGTISRLLMNLRRPVIHLAAEASFCRVHRQLGTATVVKVWPSCLHCLITASDKDACLFSCIKS